MGLTLDKLNSFFYIWTWPAGYLRSHKRIYIWSSWKKHQYIHFCSLAVNKKLFKWLRKRLYLSWLMFNNLKKLMKIVTRKKINTVFHFSRSVSSIKVLVSIKSLKQYKKLPWDKFVKKKHLKVCEIFENYVDDVADFLELYQCLLMFLCLWFIIWWSRYATQKKKKKHL